MTDEETATLRMLFEAVVEAEETAKQANIARKTARNRLAEFTRTFGVDGFGIGS
jgi:sugar diacid utilization regulator